MAVAAAFIIILLKRIFGNGSYCIYILYFSAITVDFVAEIEEAKSNMNFRFAVININEFFGQHFMKHVHHLFGIINKCVCCLATK